MAQRRGMSSRRSLLLSLQSGRQRLRATSRCRTSSFGKSGRGAFFGESSSRRGRGCSARALASCRAVSEGREQNGSTRLV